ncbi:S41 family peptidase [bacterium]|jgi:carboxyl-terminal processing protease|nr:S41 family peptidase [Bacteroidota bacterium]MCO4791512.1 S41 family peptidase [Flavobacteriales bacterium]MDB4124098.1 S41 family peptidase [Schleiferiaceae bacterium]MDB9820600.1 S41 family peptidase [bacterium]MDB4343862.1 S41 family peptidase [Schleiferiaceae bacterium]
MKRDSVVLWVFGFLIFGVWIGLQFRTDVKQDRSKLDQFFRYLEYEYVDTLDIDGLMDDAMDHILGSLDPHSAFIPAEDSEYIAQRMQGNFSGIGVEFRIHEDTLVFVSIMKNSPAASYGLLAGDRIITIDGDTVVGPQLTNDEVTSRIKGEEGTYVTFGIMREGLYLTAAVQRGIIPLESVVSTQMLGSLGYVRMERFAETTHDELLVALDRLDSLNMRGLILDLRGNPGGYLHEAVAIADEFLSEDKSIVITKYGDGKTHTSKASGGQRYEDLPLHIIIDGSSASASEVVTGALQDHDRATVYGTTSFGKGLVQEDKILSDGSKVRLTVAYYYTPSGRSIQKPYEGADLPGQMEGTVFMSDSGKVLLASGGIEPDIYLSADSSNSYYWSMSFGTMDAFAFDQIDAQRSDYELWTFERFVTDFELSDMQLYSFLEYGSYGLTLEDLSSTDMDEIRFLLKAAYAKNIWGFDAYRNVLRTDDVVLKEVVRAASTTLK